MPATIAAAACPSCSCSMPLEAGRCPDCDCKVIVLDGALVRAPAVEVVSCLSASARTAASAHSRFMRRHDR